MKSAPNVKQLPKDKFTEAVIFAGADAYAHAKGWVEGMGQQIACDSTPPIYLGPSQLAELDNLRIIDKGRRAARVYMAGDIKQIVISRIAVSLPCRAAENGEATMWLSVTAFGKQADASGKSNRSDSGGATPCL